MAEGKFISAFANKNITSVIMPNTITYIGYSAFSDNKIETLSLSNTLTSIGSDTFRNNNLTTLALPNTLKTIGSSAFSNNNLTSITIPSSVTNLEGGTFTNNNIKGENAIIYGRNSDGSIDYTSLESFADRNATEITIPSTRKTIKTRSFRGIKIDKLNIPSNVETIDFQGLFQIRASEITLNEGLKTIKSLAFAQTSNLKSLNIPNTVEEIGGSVFQYSDLNTLTIGSGIKTIDKTAFNNCNNLTSITKDKTNGNVTEINNPTYTKDSATFNIGLESPGDYIYYKIAVTNKGSLAAIAKLGNLECTDNKVIQCGAYPDNSGSTNIDNNTNLENARLIIGPNETEYYNLYIKYNSDVTTQPNITTQNINLTLTYIQSNVGITHKTIDNCYTGKVLKDGTMSITNYDESCGTEVVIPEEVDGYTVTEIAGGRWDDNLNKNFSPFANKNITSVTMPNTITNIGKMSFINNKISSLTISTNLKTIASEAFMSNNLTQVTFPETLTSIDGSAFSNNNLTKIDIPNSVTYLGTGAFAGLVSRSFGISIIMKTIHDGELVSLIRKYLVSGVMENGIVSPTKVGTPQGGNLSPLLSNIMLNELDKELEKRGLRFTRYADDCIIVVKSEKAASRVMESVTKFIEKKLGLKVNVTKSKVARPNQIKYLGYGFYYTKTGIIKPKPHLKSIQKFKRRLKQLTKRSWSIPLKERIIRLNQVIRGWINYFKIANMKCRMQVAGEHLRRRIRCLVWKQWKRSTKRIRMLMKLGANEDQARAMAYTRKKYWNTSLYLGRYITNELLNKLGLVFPLDHYSKVHTVI